MVVHDNVISYLFYALCKVADIQHLALIRKCCSNRNKITAVLYLDDIIRFKIKRLNKTLSEGRQEIKRPAKESDVACDRTSLSKVSYSLIDDSLKY